MNRSRKDIIDNMIEMASKNRKSSAKKLVYNPVKKTFESRSENDINPDNIIVVTPDDAEMF